MRAWYLDQNDRTLTTRDLYESLNIRAYSASGIEDGERELNALMEETGWRTVLEYVREPNGSNEGIPLEALGHEHKHSYQEVHYIKQGTCSFDVRDPQDMWIRMEMVPGDHFVLPSNLYHRFNPSSIKEVTIILQIVPEGYVNITEFRKA
ncbi:1,2-dihydroxy-3-keto-5-methylthiopentene dioxygenase [Ixodes scapularis]